MIIGMCGAAGSGKDTAASAIIERMGYTKVSFAAGLKDILNEIFGWNAGNWENLEWKETPNEASYGLTPRQVAQTFGTDWGRQMIDENIWVDYTMRGLEKSERNRFIFTDVRFPNEARAIREAGGILVFVTCRDRPSGTTSNAHISEAWNPWLFAFADCEVAADFGYIDELKEATLNTVENYLVGVAPRFEPDAETQEMLDELEREIPRKLEEQSA